MHQQTSIEGQGPRPQLETVKPVAHHDRRFYPPDIAHDIDHVQMPTKMKAEILSTAWEYSRSVIPRWTNWDRYVAFMRIIVMGITAEFLGDLVDLVESDMILGYNLNDVLSALFGGTPYLEPMSREYRSFLLFSSEKTSGRKNSMLFHRYVNALPRSPYQWFRMRDSDALARFTIAAALACNDYDLEFTDEQYDILAELGDAMYDAIAFWKHRAEGETNSTFAYVPDDYRVASFRDCRELLWALDLAWRDRPACQCVIAFLRVFGGPLQMMMRRYRFVEEDLTLGRPETDRVKNQTRRYYKLWNRVDAISDQDKDDTRGQKRYEQVLKQKDKLLFPGMAEYLENSAPPVCPDCEAREFYGGDNEHDFGGVQLCSTCREGWRLYCQSIIPRAIKAFPELEGTIEARPAQSPTIHKGEVRGMLGTQARAA